MTGVALAEQLRSIWQEALGVPVDGATDFFWEGGHSFMALDIVARSSQACGTDVPLRTLFDHPEFDDFVAAVTGRSENGAAA
ncbi:hypothetical protein ABH926_007773 [Catenulispora sp. GP43]|uniref:phosphopantetheine-binding protein n=1 Tax=Catenulispora sp. GP43 TaxID=3156263 RepID=UPI003518AD0E